MSEHIEVNAAEVKNHRPIPFGLLKIVAAVCLCILAGVLLLYAQPGSVKPAVASFRALGLMVGLTGVWWFIARKSVSAIADRNLNEYGLWIWLDDKLCTHWEIVLEYGMTTRYPEDLDLTRTRVALRLGLKGGGAVYVHEHGNLRGSRHWRVDLVRVNDLNGIVIVRLRDDMGGCIHQIVADEVLRLLDDHVVWPIELRDIPEEKWTRTRKTYQTTVAGLLNCFLISDEVNARQLAKAKEVEEAVAGLEEQRIGDLVELIERLRATSRFKSSIEGRRIRKELLAKALLLLPPDDPRRGGLEVQLAEIESNESREYAATRQLMERRGTRA